MEEPKPKTKIVIWTDKHVLHNGTFIKLLKDLMDKLDWLDYYDPEIVIKSKITKVHYDLLDKFGRFLEEQKDKGAPTLNVFLLGINNMLESPMWEPHNSKREVKRIFYHFKMLVEILNEYPGHYMALFSPLPNGFRGGEQHCNQLTLKLVDLARQNPTNVRMTCYRTQDYGTKLKYKDYVWLEGTFSEEGFEKLSKLMVACLSENRREHQTAGSTGDKERGKILEVLR